jgi:hypothetical protein
VHYVSIPVMASNSSRSRLKEHTWRRIHNDYGTASVRRDFRFENAKKYRLGRIGNINIRSKSQQRLLTEAHTQDSYLPSYAAIRILYTQFVA